MASICQHAVGWQLASWHPARRIVEANTGPPMNTDKIPRVQMVCQFGNPVRGVSHYADDLLAAIESLAEVQVDTVDYKAAFPGGMHPAGNMAIHVDGVIHWANPWSWRKVARAGAEVVHIQHWLAPMAGYLWPLVRLAQRNGKKVLVTVHNTNPHESMAWTDPLERRLFASADALLVHDQRGKMVLQSRLQGKSIPIHVVPLGIRLNSSQGSRIEGRMEDCALVNLDPARRYLFMFGNLRKYKGVEVLLRAWAGIKHRFPDVELVIAGRLWEGSGSLAAKLVARLLGTDVEARRLREAVAEPELVGQVHFWQGFLADDIINAMLRISEFAVFPYIRFSSQSAAACRAAGMGCPVLVSDVGGLSDLAIGPEWMVTPGDVEELSERLAARLQNQGKEEARQAQLERVRPYEWSCVAGQHCEIYRSLVPGSKRRHVISP